MKVSAIVLSVMLLFASLSLSIGASTTDLPNEISSTNISNEDEAALKEYISYSKVLKVYSVSGFYKDFYYSNDVLDILNSNDYTTFFYALDTAHAMRSEVDTYFMRDGKIYPTSNGINPKDAYEWFSGVIDTETLVVNGERKEVENMYCIECNTKPNAMIIAYDVGEEYYYAIYNQSTSFEPLYYDHATFCEVVKSYKEHNDWLQELHEENYAGGDIDLTGFKTLDVKTDGGMISPIVVIVLVGIIAIIAAVTVTCVIVIRKRRKSLT